ncbi:MAG: MinD/ParA family protein [Candidatus Margulisbacteria bacterium]|nr:MinD/ParA family protein [Candidatus Margulisiibacteriota bacterium]
MDQADNLRLLVKMKKMSAEYEKQSSRPLAKIIAFTSGKGGVGKTNLTLNLALMLSKEQGKKVLVLDADLGTANIDIMMGVIPKFNISHVILDNKSIEEIIIDGPYQVKIIPGVSGMANLTTLTEIQKLRFFEQLEIYQAKHKPDYIFIDTGAGLGNNVINFLLAADEIIVISTPEPTSMSDAYAIVKVVNQYNCNIKINVVINLAKSEQDAKRVFQILFNVSEKFLAKELNYLGFIKYDRMMPIAVKQQKPLVLSYPGADASLEILKLSKCITNKTADTNKTFKNFFEIAGRYFGWNHD